MTLRQLTDNLWICDQSISLAKVSTPIRMTIVRYGDRRLWIHSPVLLTADLLADVSKLGLVTDLVGPNCFHHLFLTKWIEKFPKAHVWLAPGLPEKTGIHGTVLNREIQTVPTWLSEIHFFNLAGLNKTNEVVFLHHPSKTLVIADLLFNMQDIRGFWPNLFWKLNDAHRRLGMSRIFRTFISNKDAFQTSLREISDLDFQRIIMAHGDLVEKDAKSRWREALRGWLE